MKPGARRRPGHLDNARSPVPRWSPTWWAAWTASIHRPGRLDDEDPPTGCDGVTPWWLHTDTSGGFGWDRSTRPDWTDLRCGQQSRDPVPTDLLRGARALRRDVRAGFLGLTRCGNTSILARGLLRRRGARRARTISVARYLRGGRCDT